MKKRLFLVALMVAIFACLFTLAVSAENKIIKLDTLPTLEQIHANPSAYVSHLDDFDKDSLGEIDSTSVVVLSDLAQTPTYYVFPSYYYMRTTNNTVWGYLTKLNDAIAAADSTAFAGYVGLGSGWSAGGCNYLIRYEVPTYVTSFSGTSKFEGDTNLKEVYFPTHIVIDEETGLEKEVAYVTSISGQNLFSSCSSLEYVHNSEFLPAGLVEGNQDGFAGCSNLKEIKIPSTAKSIGLRCFNGCSSLTEVTLPNGLTTLSKMAFANCSNLVTVRFGSDFNKFTSPNNDYETFLGSNKLKYVYLPASFADNVTATNNQFKNIFNNSQKATFFLVGDYDDALESRAKFIATNANQAYANAQIVEFDPDIDYKTYAETLGHSIIVYNYSACEAFYEGKHINAITYGFDGEDKYDSNFCMFDGCTRCVNKKATSYGKLFTDKGYAKQNNGSLFTYGIVFNTSTISLYEEKMGATFDYGFVVANGELSANLVASDGTAVDGAIALDLSKAKDNFTVYNLKLTGIKDTQKDLAVYACAYIIDNGTVIYVGDGVSSSAKAITYNSIEAVIPETNIADEQ